MSVDDYSSKEVNEVITCPNCLIQITEDDLKSNPEGITLCHVCSASG